MNSPSLTAARLGLALLAAVAALSCAPKAQVQARDRAQVQVQDQDQGNGGNIRVHKDIVYGEAGGQKLLLDVYEPAAAARAGQQRPAMLLVHGGAWAAGDKSSEAGVGERLAQQGYVALGVGYRLATDTTNKFPAQLDDVQRAVRWARAHAKDYGIDPARIGALGDSAGGHLVSLLGTMDTRDNSDRSLANYSSRVACVVDLYGPSDFTRAAFSPEAAGMVAQFLGKKPEEAPELYKAASPRFHIDTKAAPFLIFHGTADPLVPLEQSRLLHASLREAGIESTLIEFEGEGHGFQKPETLGALAVATLAFLHKHLGPGQP